MAKIIVFNNASNRMEISHRAENDPMPYSLDRTLTVREFRGSSNSPTLWTSLRTMEAWNATRRAFASPIPLGFAFKRPWEGGHAPQSQHYAGVALDVGQRLTAAQRNNLRTLAQRLGVWTYVEPAHLTPTWVHFDRRMVPPACAAGGFPVLRRGSLNNYVLTLQDSLNTAGYPTGVLDGIFGEQTENAVRNYQRARGLTADGIVGCLTWTRLMQDVVGNGRKPGTVD